MIKYIPTARVLGMQGCIGKDNVCYRDHRKGMLFNNRFEAVRYAANLCNRFGWTNPSFLALEVK